MSEQVTGTVTTNATKVTLTSNTPGGINAAIVSTQGTNTGFTFVLEIDDGSGVWAGVNSQDSAGTPGTQATGTITPGSSATKLYWVACPGVSGIRLRTTGLSTGTASVRISSVNAPLLTANQTV